MHVENVNISRSEFLEARLHRNVKSLVAIAYIVDLDRDGIVSTLIVSRKLGGNDQLVSDTTFLGPFAYKLL